MAIVDGLSQKDLVVAELSSFHLEHLQPKIPHPQIAIITNIYPDHLNRYKNYGSYQRAKLNLIKGQKKTDLAILNHDNLITRSMAKATKAQVYFFSLKSKVKGCFMYRGSVYFKRHASAPVEEILKPGLLKKYSAAFIENLLPALTASKLLGLTNADLRSGLNHFKPLPFRQQLIARYKQTTIINDSCSTTPIAALHALEDLSGSVIMILGGQDKKLDYRELTHALKKRKIKLILLPGSASKKIIKHLKRINYKPLKEVQTLAHAVKVSWMHLTNTDYLLFSPAATSFNMFANEFDRGKQFTKLIQHEVGKKK